MPLTRRKSRRGAVLRIAALALGLTALAGCQGENGPTSLGYGPKHLRPIASATQTKMRALNMTASAPILIRLYKQESVLEVWKEDRTGKFALLESYPICKWSGKLGPKVKEGDRQAPEGFYTITPGLLNPNSSYHLAFNTGFPNAYDRSLGRTGTDLMVHGACSSRGCYAMDDAQIQDIYALARESFKGGQRSFQLQAYPFKMTPENLAQHAGDPNMDFWMMLKEGSDHFEVTREVPKVDVCGRKYVFDATPANGAPLDPSRDCPILNVPQEITILVASKQAKDKVETERLVAQLEQKRKRQEEEKARDLMIASLLGAKPRDKMNTGPATPAAPTATEPATQILIASVPLPVASPNRPAAPVEIASVEPAKSSFFDSVFSFMEGGEKGGTEAVQATEAVASAPSGTTVVAAAIATEDATPLDGALVPPPPPVAPSATVAGEAAPAEAAPIPVVGSGATATSAAPPASVAVAPAATAGAPVATFARAGRGDRATIVVPAATVVAPAAPPTLAAPAAPVESAVATTGAATSVPAVPDAAAAPVSGAAAPVPVPAPNAATPPVPAEAEIASGPVAIEPAEEPSLLAKAMSLFKFN